MLYIGFDLALLAFETLPEHLVKTGTFDVISSKLLSLDSFPLNYKPLNKTILHNRIPVN